jgi:archaeal flagellar protein FlaJ
VALTRFQRWAYRVLGGVVEKSARENAHLRLALQKAHIYLRPDVYLSIAYFSMLLAFGTSAAVVIALALLAATQAVNVPVVFFVFLVPLPLFTAFVIYLMAMLVPDLKASGRAKDIDTKLPYALNYIATMSSAGITPDKIFASLAEQSIYGEVAHEAAWISRDLRLLGRDLISALTAAIDRSPSIKFQDLLQGAITALSSGENLKDYFQAKSQQFVYENRQDQKRFLENLGILAESYITVVVAAPVFLIVLLSVMLMFGGSGRNVITLGYMLILVLLPLAQLGFGATIKSVTPEV